MLAQLRAMWQVEKERTHGRCGKQDASVVGGMMHDELDRTMKHVLGRIIVRERWDEERWKLALRLFARLQHLVTARRSLNAMNSKLLPNSAVVSIPKFNNRHSCYIA